MIYVTSDWHGISLERVKELFCKVGFSDDDYCFVLGDVIDRGKYGIELIEWLMEQSNIELILGNHESMLLSCKFLFKEITEKSLNSLSEKDMEMLSVWQDNGGYPTLEALRKNNCEENEQIIRYLMDAPLYKKLSINGKKFLLTHSGIGRFDKYRDISQYRNIDLLWNRPKLSDTYFDDTITVFGHTPTFYYGNDYKGRVIRTKTWIDIDVGTGYGQKAVLLRLDDMKEFYENDDPFTL